MPDLDDDYACEFCSYGGAPTKEYGDGWGTTENKKRLCDVCANSFAGNIARYPKNYDHTSAVLAKIMSQQTNYLLEKMSLLK